MYLDKQNLFSEAQAITATAASTNVIDLGSDRNIGPGYPLGLLIQVVEDFNNLTSLAVAVQTDDNEAFSTPTTLLTTTVALADLTQGHRLPVMYVPRGNERYVRLNYTVTGTAPTTGQVTAGIVLDQDDWEALPDAL